MMSKTKVNDIKVNPLPQKHQTNFGDFRLIEVGFLGHAHPHREKFKWLSGEYNYCAAHKVTKYHSSRQKRRVFIS